MRDFLFAPEQAGTPVKALSGVEQGRLMLAVALAHPSNVLVLDEPTNDLDLETLDVLQEMLASYPGTVLLVSHDRDFLDRTVTSLVVAEGDGRWVEYAGDYSDMVAQRGKGIGDIPQALKDSPKKSAAKSSGSDKPASGSRKRLSPTEQHALKTLPVRIAALHDEIGRLERLLGDPDLYERDREAFTAAGTALTKVQGDLAAAEEEWLRLELLSEEMAQGVPSQ
jgi:ATP-binding cassette subfamily F protein uup